MGELKDFLARLSRILQRDARYREDAYLFVMASLSRAVQTLTEPRHVTGQELLEGIRREAEEQFGPMAGSVFEHWGVKNSLDFGRIVFNMVHEGILSKTDTDSLDDFDDRVFFQKLFDGDAGYRLTDEASNLSKK
jgi:uncharacterized repeat protein (TIGR04138 family)